MTWLSKLYVQVILGMLLGIGFAYLWPEAGVDMKPLGDGFIKLIKMIIAPIIFCTVVTGIAHVGDIRRAGKLGLKALIYFEVATTIALILGLAVGNISHMGSGMHIDAASLDTKALDAYTHGASSAAGKSTVDFLLNLIPQSFLAGLVNGDLLQTLTVAILFAWATMGLKPAYREPIHQAIDALSHAFFRIVNIVMHLAPIGAFGAMAYTIGKFGIGSIGSLAEFMGYFALTCLGFIVFIIGPVMRLATGLSLYRLILYLREELLIVLGTSSSESVLPQLMQKMRHLGCERQVVGMVLPTGYSFNLDGSSIYFTMAIVFLANATGTHLSLGEQISILLLMLVTSKGSAGVTGSAFIVLVATMSAVGTIPVSSAAIILGIDRFMSTLRAFANMIGNCIATITIARWENELDIPRAREVLAGKPVPELD